MRSYDRLTQALFSQYGNRKVPGRLSIFVDLTTREIYAVPIGQEHIDFAKELKSIEDRLALINACARLIPSHISIMPSLETHMEEVDGFLTGESGLEIGLGVRHARSDLEIAHQIAKEFAQRGEFSIAYELKEDKISYRYVID